MLRFGVVLAQNMVGRVWVDNATKLSIMATTQFCVVKKLYGDARVAVVVRGGCGALRKCGWRWRVVKSRQPEGGPLHHSKTRFTI